MSVVGRIFRDKLWLSAAGVVVVFIVAIAYIFAEVLDQPLTSRPLTVDVELEQTGGLFEGSAVTYRGIKIGKVSEIVPSENGVVASVRIATGTEIPADSAVRVRSLSPVGEQYLDFQPADSKGPYLESGDTIDAEATDIPKSLSSTVVAVNDVLRQIDDKKLRVVLGELSDGLAGTGDDLGRILDQGNQILATLDGVWPETNRVITNGGTVLDIGNDNADSLRLLGTRAKEFAAFLADYDDEFRGVLDRAPEQIEQLKALLRDANKVLPGFLSVGVSFTDIVRSYEPHLRALLQEYAPGLGVLPRFIVDGEAKLDIFGHRTRRCDYNHSHQEPYDPTQRSFYQDGRCSASFATLQRGAAHAPGPVR